MTIYEMRFQSDIQENIKMVGGGKPAPSTTTTTQTSEPWEEQKPYLTEIFSEAQSQYEQPGPEFYPDSTVVENSPETEAALAMQTNRAMYGDPNFNAANNQMGLTQQGAFLNSNPYLDAQYDRAANRVSRAYQTATAPQAAASAAAQGRYGSGAYNQAVSQNQQNLGNTLGDLGADIYGKNYEAERENMMKGLFAAPQFAQQSYVDINALGDVGRQREGLEQARLNEDITRHNFEQGQDANKLAQYMQMVQGSYGGSSTATGTNPAYRGGGGGGGLSGMLGGAMGGAQMGGSMGGGWGALGGGILGGLGGLFG